MAAKNGSKGAKSAPKQEQPAEIPTIKARIDRMLDLPDSKLKAVASVTIGSSFAVHGLRVMDGRNGLFVNMPQSSYTDKNGERHYSDQFHAITAEARTAINDSVLAAYEQELAESDDQTENAELDEDERLPFDMSM